MLILERWERHDVVRYTALAKAKPKNYLPLIMRRIMMELLLSAENRLTLSGAYAINNVWKGSMLDHYLLLPKNIFAT